MQTETIPAAAEPKRGRKPANESRATEFRLRLWKWKQTPEAERISLRALAVELNTSHQLLSSYLDTLDEWLQRERSEQYRRMAAEILDRARAEGRGITERERAQWEAYNRESVRHTLDRLIEKAADRWTREMRNALKAGKRREAIGCARLLARTGNREAIEFLKSCSKITK